MFFISHSSFLDQYLDCLALEVLPAVMRLCPDTRALLELIATPRAPDGAGSQTIHLHSLAPKRMI